MPKTKRYIRLSTKDRKDLIIAVKKILGQLESIKIVLEKDEVEDQTFNQLLAVKGGASRICKEIIARGVLPNFDQYSPEEINHALDIIFKLD